MFIWITNTACLLYKCVYVQLYSMKYLIHKLSQMELAYCGSTYVCDYKVWNIMYYMIHKYCLLYKLCEYVLESILYTIYYTYYKHHHHVYMILKYCLLFKYVWFCNYILWSILYKYSNYFKWNLLIVEACMCVIIKCGTSCIYDSQILLII